LLDIDKTGNKIELVDSYSYSINNQILVVTMTMNQVMIVDVKQKQIKCSFQSSNIKAVEKKENQLIIKLVDHVIQTKDGYQKVGIELKQREIILKSSKPEIIQHIELKLNYLL
jgi:hypothetical protein